MPLNLVPPRPPSKNWRIRGTYLGKYLDRSSGTSKRAVAAKILKSFESQIERGSYAEPGEETFGSAAAEYIRAGGERRFLPPLLEHFRDTPLSKIGQREVDDAAAKLLPLATPGTRNRQVYTPVCAVLKRAGKRIDLRRPKGAGGAKATAWLWPEQTEKIFEEARKIKPEFEALLITLCYTGLRLGEVLHRETLWRLPDAFAYVIDTKNGQPRGVFLPPIVVATLANLPDWSGFRFAKGGHLYEMLKTAAFKAGVDLPRRSAFHIFRHTFMTWMRRYGGLDELGLLNIGTHKDRKSVAQYTHVVVTEEARRAERLPTPKARKG